jgi:hypothetical protein
MPKVMSEIGAIPKGHRNKQQNYRFRSVDDVLNALHPVLVRNYVSFASEAHDHRMTIVEEPKPGGGVRRISRATLSVDVTFYAPDGSSIVSTAAGEGVDYNGDKATNKAMAAAFKYALFYGLVIPLAEIEDSDADAPQPEPSATPKPDTDDKPSQSAGEKCGGGQRERIVVLAQKLGMTPTDLKAIVRKGGAETLQQLRAGQAERLIGMLQAKITEKEATDRF